MNVKSFAGGTYAATQNPTGAVAKVNQVAATQPPTVIIQATGGAVPQCVPKFLTGSTRPPIPSCSSGYTQVWADQSASASGGWYIDTCTAQSGDDAVYNINGSDISFRKVHNSSSGHSSRAFVSSSAMSILGGTSTGYYDMSTTVVSCSSSTYTQAWSAALCCK